VQGWDDQNMEGLCVMTNFSPENGLGVPEFDQMFAHNDFMG